MRISIRASLTFRQSELAGMRRTVLGVAQSCRRPAQSGMALAFHDCVMKNFGATGLFRPWSGWPPLSPRYAAKVGRTYATLEVTGRMKAAVKVESEDRAARVVSSDADVPYATAHQRGVAGGVPQREYFPIFSDGTVYPEVRDIAIDAARRECARVLGGGVGQESVMEGAF